MTIEAPEPRHAMAPAVALNKIMTITEQRRLASFRKQRAGISRLGSRWHYAIIRQHVATVSPSIDRSKDLFGIDAESPSNDQIALTVSVEIIRVFSTVIQDAVCTNGSTR